MADTAGIVTLTTDFGLRDAFVGTMKGVILSICSRARIVDLTHELDFADIYSASFVLETSHRYFPRDTIHTVVVDPGVGSERRALAARTSAGIFIAPDNGCLSAILRLYPQAEIRSIDNPEYTLKERSATFHGRDVFAPAAAHLCRGEEFAAIGKPVQDPVTLPNPEFHRTVDHILASILYIDRFGNIITNIPDSELDDKLCGRSMLLPYGCELTYSPTYSGIPEGALGLISGSSGYLEVAMKGQSAAAATKAVAGDIIMIIIS